MEMVEADFTVIGSGPAGQKGAIQAAKIGKKVVVIDRDPNLGGACLHHGTIPSKTLREAVLDLTSFQERSYYGKDHDDNRIISIHDLNFRLTKVIMHQQAVVERQMTKNNIQIIVGSAEFVDRHMIRVLDEDGETLCMVRTEHALIATGSSPRQPLNIEFDKDTIMDSDQLLQLHHVPKSLMVLGGGIIGCEYATMFAALGTKVILIDKAPKPMGFVDGGILEHFMQYAQGMGMELKFGEEIVEIGKTNENVAFVKLANDEEITSECLFVALGRQANTKNLGLERIGLELSSRGYIQVNSMFQTAVPHIYAAGDVIGIPSLAATSMEQGRLAARNAFALKSRPFPEFFPYGIYTIPEISSVGPTEEELKAKDINYQVGLAYYYEIGRGPINGDDKGLIKIIFHAETLEVLAVHIIGTGATELIHIGQLAIDFHARVNYFVEQVFNYPTFAEGYRIAALNGINKLTGKKVPAGWMS